MVMFSVMNKARDEMDVRSEGEERRPEAASANSVISRTCGKLGHEENHLESRLIRSSRRKVIVPARKALCHDRKSDVRRHSYHKKRFMSSVCSMPALATPDVIVG